MPDPTKINKAIREIRKENYDEDKKLRDLRFLLDPEKDHYKQEKTISVFNKHYIEYESTGDKDKNLSIKEYIDIIRPYLSDIINIKTQGEWKIHSGNIIIDYKTQGAWKIHLTIAFKFISSKDSNETQTMHSKSDNIEIMTGSETDGIIEELFESLLQRYQEGLEESMKGSEFIFDILY